MDEQEFKSKLLPIGDKLYRFALGFLKVEQEAEDALQEVFMKLWSMRQKLKQYRSVEALAMTMIRNHCLDKLKLRKTYYIEDQSSYTEGATGEPDPENRMQLKNSMEMIRKCMDRLPETQRTILDLRDIQGYEYKEIAAVMNMNINNIRVSLSRARKFIREQYDLTGRTS